MSDVDEDILVQIIQELIRVQESDGDDEDGDE